MQDQYNVLLIELQKMVRLLSLIAVGGKKQRQQINILSKAGFQPKEIANLLGTTPNTVSVALNYLKKQAGRKKLDLEDSPQ